VNEIARVKVPRLYLQVAEELQQQITQKVFRKGERLPSERELAGKLGVSRPTIREAMIALELAGLVEVRSGSGVYVVDAAAGPVAVGNDPGPFEILEARRLIEGESCALAAQRINDEQLQQLQALLREMARENEREDTTEQADQQFHRLIAAAAGNSAIAGTIGWLWQLRNDSGISTHFHRKIRKQGKRPIIADHRAILDALRARNPEAARRAMHLHLQRVIDQLLDEN